jgi:4-hydroxybenzoate polyprenyltransferase
MNSNKWLIFIKERFDPLSHSLMILVFVSVHILIAKKLFLVSMPPLEIFILIMAVTLFYFKLRLYDEVKDYELDLVINSNRPLPRGLLNHQNMYNGMIFCIVFEYLLFGIRGIVSLSALSFPILYSLLMYKEFFIKEKIRPHLTTYAVSHTIVTSFLTIAIFSFINQQSFFSNLTNSNLFYFAMINWMLFNIFEFGRKTFAISEERPNVDTYSSLFGKRGAVLLVISQAVVAFVLMTKIRIFHSSLIMYSNIILLLLLTNTGIVFIFSKKSAHAKYFRTMSSVYIIIFYLILIIGLIL